MSEEFATVISEVRRGVIVMMKKVWSVKDLALVLDISESRVRHMAAEQLIPTYRQNGALYFKREEIEAWQTRNRIASKDEIESQAATYYATKRISK